MTAPEWSALLDRFERDLDSASEIIEPWTPPADPLPVELADRARRLLLRQQERIARAREDLDGIRQQLDAVRRVPSVGRSDAPAYLDVNG